MQYPEEDMVESGSLLSWGWFCLKPVASSVQTLWTLGMNVCMFWGASRCKGLLFLCTSLLALPSCLEYLIPAFQ